jgi:hypothetical protein
MTATVVQQHFVTFYSPGTFMAEQSALPIVSWDTAKALEMAAGVKERHGATPYGFRFSTRGRGPDDLDSREIAKSPMYYFGVKVETLAEVEARGDPGESIRRANMRGNGWDRIATTTSGWKWTQPLGADDVVLETAS